MNSSSIQIPSRRWAFTAVESVVMLAVLFLFSMILVALTVRFDKNPDSMNFPFQMSQKSLDAEKKTDSIEGSP
jgi:hypothetical protein